MSDDTTGGELLIHDHGPVRVLTLNRPDRLNALSESLAARVVSEVQAADRSEGVSVVVLRGAGRSFCSGFDMRAAVDGEVQHYGSDSVFDEFRMIRGNNHSFRPLWESSIPIVSAIHGHCLAGGLELVLHTDIVVCARSAKFGFPPARSQGSPPSSLLVQRLGLQWAKRMLFTGDLMGGETAARVGLALEVVDDDELDARALTLAARIALIDKGLLAANKLSANLAAGVANLSLSNDVTALVDAATCSLPAVRRFRDQARATGATAAWKERNSAFKPDEPI